MFEKDNLQSEGEWVCPVCQTHKNSTGSLFSGPTAVSLHVAGKYRTGDRQHRGWAREVLGESLNNPSVVRSINTLADALFVPVKEANALRHMLENQRLERLMQDNLFANKPSVQAYVYLTESESSLHQFVKAKLIQELGEDEKDWWMKGIPQKIRLRCVTTREEKPSREEAYAYTNLIDLGTIIANNWRIFDTCFRPFREHVKSKNDIESMICRVNEIRNKVFHSTSPTRTELADEEISLLRSFHELVKELTKT
jgi:hypothetical protein